MKLKTLVDGMAAVPGYKDYDEKASSCINLDEVLSLYKAGLCDASVGAWPEDCGKVDTHKDELINKAAEFGVQIDKQNIIDVETTLKAIRVQVISAELCECFVDKDLVKNKVCLLYTSPSPRDRSLS
eukprot:4769986-Pyramimonas_sp.AAC.1